MELDALRAHSRSGRSAFIASLRAIGTHLGHDLAWLLIAALFCVVEAIVHVTEFNPIKRLRARVATAPSSAPPLRTPVVETGT